MFYKMWIIPSKITFSRFYAASGHRITSSDNSTNEHFSQIYTKHFYYWTHHIRRYQQCLVTHYKLRRGSKCYYLCHRYLHWYKYHMTYINVFIMFICLKNVIEHNKYKQRVSVRCWLMLVFITTQFIERKQLYVANWPVNDYCKHRYYWHT